MHSTLTCRLESRRSLALELAKYSAFLLMLLDHLNAYLLGGAHSWMWELGRVVFPMFAVVLGLGLRGAGPGRVLEVAKRIAVVAVVAEACAWPLLDAGVRPMYLNVCVTLAAGCLLVDAERRSRFAQDARDTPRCFASGAPANSCFQQPRPLSRPPPSTRRGLPST